MNFEDMKKIWDSQNQQTMFAIDEKALHDRIKSQKAKSIRTTEIMEMVLFLVNILTGLFLIVFSFITDNHEIATYIMSSIMIGTAIYIWRGRIKRKKLENKYGGSILGDLDEAIAVSSYKADLNFKMLTWYMAAIILTSLLSLINADADWWIYPGVILFFALTILAGRWKHKSIHLARKNKLLNIKKQFTEEWKLQ